MARTARTPIRLTPAYLERHAPLLVAIAAAAAWVGFDRSARDVIVKELVIALWVAGIVGAGFLMSALSILLALIAAPVMRQLRRAQYDEDVYRYLHSAINSCLTLAALCVAAFYFYQTRAAPWIAVALVFQAVYAGAAALRISRALLGVFQRALDNLDHGG